MKIWENYHFENDGLNMLCHMNMIVLKLNLDGMFSPIDGRFGVLICRHAWMTYMTNEPPTIDPSLKLGNNPTWEKPWTGTTTQTLGAYRPYSTVKLKYQSANDTLKPKERE